MDLHEVQCQEQGKPGQTARHVQEMQKQALSAQKQGQKSRCRQGMNGFIKKPLWAKICIYVQGLF
ncbi:MAG: hypothetical protein HY392_01395 [Candidatus Diapherotrites archaeon]|nr:hypothetical protein [Candidatus Diapherotrites archaeon]